MQPLHTAEATESLVVLDAGCAAVIRDNPTTGDRTIISDALTGRDPLLQREFGKLETWPKPDIKGNSCYHNA